MDFPKSLASLPNQRTGAESENQESHPERELAGFDSRNPFVVLGGSVNETFSEMKALKNDLLKKFHPT